MGFCLADHMFETILDGWKTGHKVLPHVATLLIDLLVPDHPPTLTTDRVYLTPFTPTVSMTKSAEPLWTDAYLGAKAAHYFTTPPAGGAAPPPPPPAPVAPPRAQPPVTDRIAHLQAQFAAHQESTTQQLAQLEASNAREHAETRSLLQKILDKMCGASSSTAP